MGILIKSIRPVSLMEFSYEPSLAVFAFRGTCAAQTKHRSGLRLPTRAKQFARSGHKKSMRPAGVPCGKIPDGIFLRAGPRGFCLSRHRCRSNKNIAPAFASRRGQSSLPAPGTKSPCARRESPAVKSLTGFSFGPGLAVFAFRGTDAAQTKTSLRPSPPDAGKAVCPLRAQKIHAPGGSRTHISSFGG